MTQPQKDAPHYRMYVDDVYRDYRDGLMTVKGAVYCIIAATYMFGEAVHLNVSEFLARTGIHPRSYARAVQTLLDEGRLDFPPNAIQSLRIPTVKGTRQPLHYSLSTNSGQICDREGSICPDEGQICDREGQICPEEGSICPEESPETPPPNESTDPSITLSTLSFSLSHRERDGNEAPDEYEEWLLKKAAQLPTPPTLMQEWLEKNKHKKSNRKEFSKYKQARDQANVPQPAAPAIFEKEAETEAQQRLGLMRHWWSSGSVDKVRTTIAAHPEWRLQIGEAGPEEVTS